MIIRAMVKTLHKGTTLGVIWDPYCRARSPDLSFLVWVGFQVWGFVWHMVYINGHIRIPD